MFAVDLSVLPPGKSAVVDTSAVGYPDGLGALPPGDYVAQAIVNVYEQIHRADGKTIWVHFNDGTIEFFSNAAGNLYSDVVKVRRRGRGRGGTRLRPTRHGADQKNSVEFHHGVRGSAGSKAPGPGSRSDAGAPLARNAPCARGHEPR